MKRIGSNQHKTRWGLHTDTWASIWFICFVTTIFIILFQPRIISPCADGGCKVHVVYAKDEATELEQITRYIIEKFEPEGRNVAVRALACFISESGLRPKAVGVNNNGTNDVGVAQINSIHGMSTEARMDYKKNIDKAYTIYKRRGWGAWYGKECQ